MKAVRPITVLILGPAALAMAVTCGAWFALPQERTLAGILAAFGIGAVGGLTFFGPIAGALAIRASHSEWFTRHYWQIQWYVSLPMMLALGYFAACIRHGIFDTMTFACMTLVALGAALKIGLSGSARNHASPS
jgi:hypothetical protein